MTTDRELSIFFIGYPRASNGDDRSSDRNRFVNFCQRVENRNSRRAGGLRKPFFSHVIDVFSPVQFVNDLADLCLCGVYHRCFERFIVLSVLELHFSDFAEVPPQ